MKVREVSGVVMLLMTLILYSESKPRVAILDFKATGVSAEHAEIVTEIFRSKIITSSVFDVLERKNLENIMMENSLGLSGLVEKPSEVGKLLGAEYLITGSFMKMGNKLLMTVNLINVETGKITGSTEMTIDNMDSVYDSLTILTTDLIKSSLGLNKFTFSTETEGLSLEFGGNYLTDTAGDGIGFTLGISNGRGNFWSGYSTTWNFTSIKRTDNNFGSEKKIIGCFGAGNFIFGNKVEKLALLLGIGAGYDFQGGILAIPSIGGYYKNFYLKYSHPLVIDPSGDNSIESYKMIEIGYSYFMGTFGKGVVNFN